MRGAQHFRPCPGGGKLHGRTSAPLGVSSTLVCLGCGERHRTILPLGLLRGSALLHRRLSGGRRGSLYLGRLEQEVEHRCGTAPSAEQDPNSPQSGENESRESNTHTHTQQALKKGLWYDHE